MEYTYEWNYENYGKEGEPILKITKSSLGTFDWCPTKYDFSYRQRLPQDQTEAMKKGTICHTVRENFFNDFDIKKAENMSNEEVYEYCVGLIPINDYMDINLTMASFESQRFIEARDEGKINEFLPICNEGQFDAEIIIPKNTSEKFPLMQDYTIHIQGIIDRIFTEDGNLIPFEFKTGAWKDYKSSAMRKEMAFYQLLIENSSEEVLIANGLNPEQKVTHWGWYYPASNHVQVEPIKKRTMTSVMENIARLIHAYENEHFPPKFFFKTCSHCSFFGICAGAEEDSWS